MWNKEVRKNKYTANMESPTKKQIQCKYGKKKNKSNANMESPITILWNVSKPRPDDREALRAGSAHSKPENGHRCMFANARTNTNTITVPNTEIQLEMQGLGMWASATLATKRRECHTSWKTDASGKW